MRASSSWTASLLLALTLAVPVAWADEAPGAPPREGGAPHRRPASVPRPLPDEPGLTEPALAAPAPLAAPLASPAPPSGPAERAQREPEAAASPNEEPTDGRAEQPLQVQLLPVTGAGLTPGELQDLGRGLCQAGNRVPGLDLACEAPVEPEVAAAALGGGASGGRGGAGSVARTTRPRPSPPPAASRPKPREGGRGTVRVGGRVDSSLELRSKVTKVGISLTLDLELVDVALGEVIGRVSRTVEEEAATLAPQIGSALEELVRTALTEQEQRPARPTRPGR